MLSTEQQQNSSLTPNPSPDSINEKVNANEQISLEENIKDGNSSKFVSDDEQKEKLLRIKTEINKNVNIATSTSATTIESSRMSALIDINIANIKTEHMPTEIDMDIESNQMNDSNYLNNALENMFGESNLNENETKMSFDSNDQNKKSDCDRKGDNFNDSSDSSDDTDDDSDDSTDSDDEDEDDDDKR